MAGHNVTVPREELRLAMRSAEASAEIMRDPERTGRWAGAERTARAFDRIARRLRQTLDLYSPETVPHHFSPRDVTPKPEIDQ